MKEWNIKGNNINGGFRIFFFFREVGSGGAGNLSWVELSKKKKLLLLINFFVYTTSILYIYNILK